MNDDGKMTVYIGNSARKTKMIPIFRDLVMGVRRKERGIRVFECNEAESPPGKTARGPYGR